MGYYIVINSVRTGGTVLGHLAVWVV